MGRQNDRAALQRYVEGLGGKFVRRAKHGYLYRLPNGNTILIAGSPGDSRSWANTMSYIKNALKGDRKTS